MNDPHEWLELGVERGWCTPLYCDTHDGLPNPYLELLDGDRCVFVVVVRFRTSSADMREPRLERCANCGAEVDPDWDAHGVGVEWFCELCCPICELDDDGEPEP